MTKNSGHNNLIPPKHGEIRNPKGRGKGVRNRSTIYRALMDAARAGNIDETNADAVVAALFVKALEGDVSAARELMDSAYGKLVDKSESTVSVTTMPTIKDDDGKEIEFDIGRPPDQKLITEE